MLPQPSRTVALAVKKLLPARLPPSLSHEPGNLYEILSRTPRGGVGKEVHQIRWTGKHISDCWWRVTKTRFKCEGKHGKAWGKLYWRGKLISDKEERIRGSLKYTWAEGRSKLPKSATTSPPATSTAPAA